ncbi:hypothetical protein CDAR_292961 [Caerostris darwini]|uniref:Uncharacterized protein n=1 Tax=Caerostris darwini TaxID=1538125 RepID=A0AAV4THH0_9ARAC|nr:hypothetical protein CDAR_292961 [Caerostris darwini]
MLVSIHPLGGACWYPFIHWLEHAAPMLVLRPDTAEEIIGIKRRKANKEWIMARTRKLTEKRKKINHMLESIKSERQLQEYREKYREADRNVKRNAKRDKKEFYEALAVESQRVAKSGEIGTVYQRIK